MSDAIYILAAYGLCFGVMNDRIPIISRFRRVAFADRMFQCAYCTGFHCGWVTWCLRYTSTVLPETPVIHVTLWSLSSAAFCYGADTILRRMEILPVQED